MTALSFDGARVLVTRSEPGASRTAARLSALGAQPLIAPVLRATHRDVNPSLATDVQAVLVTSGHGARALARLAATDDVVILAIGDASAAAARAAGYTEVLSANGDGADLVDLALSRLAPGAGPLVHVRGVHVARAIGDQLRSAGFTVRDVIAYEALPADALPEPATEALRAGALDAALFHSPRGAAVFTQLSEDIEASSDSLRPIAVAISPAALAPLPERVFRALTSADRPNEEAMLKALHRALAAGH